MLDWHWQLLSRKPWPIMAAHIALEILLLDESPSPAVFTTLVLPSYCVDIALVRSQFILLHTVISVIATRPMNDLDRRYCLLDDSLIIHAPGLVVY